MLPLAGAAARLSNFYRKHFVVSRCGLLKRTADSSTHCRSAVADLCFPWLRFLDILLFTYRQSSRLVHRLEAVIHHPGDTVDLATVILLLLLRRPTIK